MVVGNQPTDEADERQSPQRENPPALWRTPSDFSTVLASLIHLTSIAAWPLFARERTPADAAHRVSVGCLAGAWRRGSVGREHFAVGADEVKAVDVEVAGVDEYPDAGTELADVAVQLYVFARAVGQGDDQGAYVGGDACDECPGPEVGGAAVGADVSSWRYRWTSAASTPGT